MRSSKMISPRRKLCTSNKLQDLLLLNLIFIGFFVGFVASSAILDNMDALDIIEAQGFTGKRYTIKMLNYSLTLTRLSNPLADPKRLYKYPVLYGHGILYDSSTMLSRSTGAKARKPVIGVPTYNLADNGQYNATDQSLPFLLSNNNFDVWLFDARGTNSKNRRTKLFDFSQTFWDFSLDDEALVDLPILMNFVLRETQSSKLIYVGFSESTFFMFALLATVPEYADKIAAYVAMAPVTYVSHLRGLTLPLLTPIAFLIPEKLRYSFLPQFVVDFALLFFQNLCRTRASSKILCGPLVESVGGPSRSIFGSKFFEHFLRSTSMKAAKQFKQLFFSKRFGMFDYGPTDNLKLYNDVNPPAYDLSRIKSDRIILVRGGQDYLSAPLDQEQLLRELGTKPYRDIVIPDYNHFDFIDGEDVDKKVNLPVLKSLFELISQKEPGIMGEVNSTLANATTTIQPPSIKS